MFSGIVESLAPVVSLEPMSPGTRLAVSVPAWATEAEIGESVAVNGCCLTVVQIEEDRLVFEAGPETLRRTNLSQLTLASTVNLERALCLGDRLGGHLVTGHIDAVGHLDRRVDEGEWSTCWFRVPASLGRQMVPKGSIAVDGVSLTLVDVDRDCFSVMLIPHTLEVTTLGQRAVGDAVNLETDLLAKYVEKQLLGTTSEGESAAP